jgi:purine nucleosidase
MARQIILDCDPGHDDAIAILLAAGDPHVELIALTTVAGNQTLDKVTRNAGAVARVAGIRDIPFAAGADRPLVRDQITAGDVHGESGLDGPDLPEPLLAMDRRHAADVIIDEVMKREPDTLTLVPIGPLTNIALAVRKEQQLVDRVADVVLMGGGYHGGNRTATAEFNILADPEAAHIVFNQPWQVTMVGLDLTHQARATPDVLRRIDEIDTGPSRFVGKLLDFYGRRYRAQHGIGDPPVHDPCAVARIIDPAIVQTTPVPIDIELTGTLTYGMTVADFRRPASPGCTTSAAITLDQDRFWGLVLAALSSGQT